jgi:predicted GIY-YIG superfamily endonuclease
MVHWIYILKCENDVYYVGETTRLYRRFWEHQDGCGGLNTQTYPPEKLVAIYQVHRLYKFINHIKNIQNNNFNTGYDIFFDRGGIYENFNLEGEYEYFDYRWTENFIVEKLMIDRKEKWKNIRGGNYTRFNVNYCFPTNEYVKEIPNCHCGLPCDIRKNEDENYLYFRCSKKNMWDEMIDYIDIEVEYEPCNFFMKFSKDFTYNVDYENRKLKIKELLKKSGWLRNLGFYDFCVGGCGKSYNDSYCIRYSGRAINLCFDCFLNDNIRTKLKDEHPDFEKGKCLIDLGKL